jgi:hypothetical protein
MTTALTSTAPPCEWTPSHTTAVCATSEEVERAGIEPATFGLQSRRSPS